MITDFKTGNSTPTPEEIKSYMQAKQKQGELTAKDIFVEVRAWLRSRKLDGAVSAQLVEQYAMAAGRWIQCENAISQYGFLAKHPTTGAAIASPYVSMAQSYLKQATAIWQLIEDVVAENADKVVGMSPEDEQLEMLIGGRK